MAVNGALKLLVLKVLSTEKRKGSQISKTIEDKTGWKVSPGSLYPLMQELVNLKLTSVKKQSNTKIYSITLKGNRFLRESDKKKNEILKKIEEGVKFLKLLGEEDCINNIIDNFDKKHLKLIPITNEFIALEKAINSLDIKNNQTKIKVIIKEAINKMKKLK